MSNSALRYIKDIKRYEKFYGLNNTINEYDEEIENAKNKTNKKDIQESKY